MAEKDNLIRWGVPYAFIIFSTPYKLPFILTAGFGGYTSYTKMGNDSLNKLDSFFRRHLLIASFICLSILIHILTLPIHIKLLIEQLKQSLLTVIATLIYLSVLNIIPILFISLFLYLSISFERTPKPSLTLRQTFFISLISNFIIIFFLYSIFWAFIAEATPIYYYLILGATSFVYSFLFASFFSWFGNTPNYITIFRYKIDIGKYDSAAIVLFFNLLVNTLMCLFSWAHILLHISM